jgi:hypothetical protein
MIAIDEHQALEQVQSRLVERFPQVLAETVHVTVQDVHDSLHWRVRDFVPIPVEREATARLTALVAQDRLQTLT